MVTLVQDKIIRQIDILEKSYQCIDILVKYYMYLDKSSILILMDHFFYLTTFTGQGKFDSVLPSEEVKQ